MDEDQTLLIELVAPGLPLALAVFANGRVVDRQIGELSAARLGELVSRLAAETIAP